MMSYVANYEPMKMRFLTETIVIFLIMAYAQSIIINLYGQLVGQTEMRKTMEQIMMGKPDMLTDAQKDRFEQDVN